MGCSDTIWKKYFETPYDSVLLYTQPYLELLHLAGTIVKENIEKIPDQSIRILELGTGSGNFLVSLQNNISQINNRTFSIVGVDKTDTALQKASVKLSNFDNVTLLKGNIGMQNFGINNKIYNTIFEKKYHFIVLINTFYTLNLKEKFNIIHEIKKILSTYGYLIIIDPWRSPIISHIMIEHIKKIGFFHALQILLTKQKLHNIVKAVVINKKFIAQYTFFNNKDQEAFFTEFGFIRHKSITNLYGGNNFLHTYSLKSVN